ncbi:MAG: acyl-CoA thioesterase [Halobacteriovoraceae bacterium]|nr:acyl-CoA thioesterase [Halobacteriovoraceae bacterium]
MDEQRTPQGEISIRTLAMPADTNPTGDIFGGWVLSQMDIAGGIATKKFARKRVVTVAVDSMIFHLPVFVGDTLCCYTNIIKTGRTSITVKIEAWAAREIAKERVLVTEGIFTYVCVNEERKPIPIKD